MARGESVPRLEREIERLRVAITETETEHARHAALAEEAAAARRAAAEDPAAFGEAARRAAEHRDERDRLGFVLERRRQDLAELERRLELARYEEARGVLKTALARQADASKAFAAKVGAADKAAAGVVAARDEVDAARARARELCPSDVDFEAPGPDEPEWPDIDRLIETLQAGPRRPHAKAAAGSAQVRREAGQRIASHGAQAAREAIVDGDFERLGRITPKERHAAVAAAEELANSLPTNERARAVAQRRLERVRELATAVEQVEATA
jgi:hypothetical protein